MIADKFSELLRRILAGEHAQEVGENPEDLVKP